MSGRLSVSWEVLIVEGVHELNELRHFNITTIIRVNKRNELVQHRLRNTHVHALHALVKVVTTESRGGFSYEFNTLARRNRNSIYLIRPSFAGSRM